jgi:type III pantothenate kinase
LYNLLIDIGNSEVKAGKGKPDESEIKLIKRFPYSKKTFRRDFKENFKSIEDAINKNGIQKTGISILKDGDKIFLKEFIKKKFGINPLFISRKINLPVKIDYGRGIGNDRICNAAGARKIFRAKNILIIDFGTATTYTFISGKIIRGGLISPGIKTSMLSLIQRTSLPEVEFKFPSKIINDNTEDNIKGGILFQSLYSAEGIIRELKKEHRSLYVVLTGGYSELFKDRMSSVSKTEQNLALIGINSILNQ